MSYNPYPFSKRKLVTTSKSGRPSSPPHRLGQSLWTVPGRLYEAPKQILKTYGKYEAYKKFIPSYYTDYAESKMKFETNRYVLYDHIRKLTSALQKTQTQFQNVQPYSELQTGKYRWSNFQGSGSRYSPYNRQRNRQLRWSYRKQQRSPYRRQNKQFYPNGMFQQPCRCKPTNSFRRTIHSKWTKQRYSRSSRWKPSKKFYY